MKLSEWAKKQGITYRTAWEHFRTGKISGAYKLQSGAIIVPDGRIEKQEFNVTYARISSSESRKNLESQSKRLIDFCNARGWQTHLNIKETGSGLNDKRKKLEDVLLKGQASRLIVEHEDRLARFGVRYIEILCKHIGCELVILNVTDSDREELIQDFVSLVTSFCTTLYGQKKSRKKTEKLIKELCCEEEKKKK
ncbi:MAG: IS607 family transposase [Desulfobacteraceae bacterium]|nr:IS607 family transposase [Desulfobacteraceae bacterium]